MKRPDNNGWIEEFEDNSSDPQNPYSDLDDMKGFLNDLEYDFEFASDESWTEELKDAIRYLEFRISTFKNT